MPIARAAPLLSHGAVLHMPHMCSGRPPGMLPTCGWGHAYPPKPFRAWLQLLLVLLRRQHLLQWRARATHWAPGPPDLPASFLPAALPAALLLPPPTQRPAAAALVEVALTRRLPKPNSVRCGNWERKPLDKQQQA